jgi:hypothetical protein
MSCGHGWMAIKGELAKDDNAEEEEAVMKQFEGKHMRQVYELTQEILSSLIYVKMMIVISEKNAKYAS